MTIIRTDLWRRVRNPATPLEKEPEDFKGVTQAGLNILGISKLSIQIGNISVEHPVLIADKIAHKFIGK